MKSYSRPLNKDGSIQCFSISADTQRIVTPMSEGVLETEDGNKIPLKQARMAIELEDGTIQEINPTEVFLEEERPATEEDFALDWVGKFVLVWDKFPDEWDNFKKLIEEIDPQKRSLFCKALLEELKRQGFLEDDIKKYAKMLQAKATNAFQHTSKRDFLLNPATQTASANKNGVEIFVKGFSNIILNVPTHKVLDALTIKLTNGFPCGENVPEKEINAHREVTITVNEYMELCGIKDRKEARKQLKAAINSLYDASLEWEETRYIIPEGKKRRVKQTIPWKTRILDTQGGDPTQDPVQNGKVTVKFAYDMADYLSKAFPMAYPTELLNINGKQNPHSYYIGRKLIEHSNMNIGKSNANRISVSTLCAACPDLPIYDEIIERARGSITQKIIQPFERDLIALKDKYGILADWHYCNSKGVPLTNEQVERYDYSTWIEWLVEFELADYPGQSERIAK